MCLPLERKKQTTKKSRDPGGKKAPKHETSEQGHTVFNT